MNNSQVQAYKKTIGKPKRTRFLTLTLVLLLNAAGFSPRLLCADYPRSDSGLDYYAQGGVAVDGVAYFTSTDGCRRKGVVKPADFPAVAAFDVNDYHTIKTYPFAQTYDSSPLVIQRKDGTWLVLAHEHKNSRTVAINRDSGRLEWTSAANQPGSYFFGYSYYTRDDGSTLIFAAAPNGLHALSSESGDDVWWVKAASRGAITPCVDQRRGWVFYQCNGRVMKIRAADGEVLRAVEAAHPNTCISWNTVLADDSHGYFVITRWFGRPEWDCAIRTYDKDLNLVWGKTGLPGGKKDVLTYAEGKIVTGCGNGWGKYTGNTWRYIEALAVADGRRLWKCDLSKHEFNCIPNVPYFNGCFYAESQGTFPPTCKLFRIDAAGGKLLEALDYGRAITACASCIIAHGKIFSGDLWQDRIVVTKLAENSKADWPGPFCNPQTNTYAVPRESGVKLVPMQEVKEIAEDF